MSPFSKKNMYGGELRFCRVSFSQGWVAPCGAGDRRVPDRYDREDCVEREYKHHHGLPYAVFLTSLHVTVLLYSSTIAAEVYKCPSANGKWVLSGTPCANGLVRDGNECSR